MLLSGANPRISEYPKHFVASSAAFCPLQMLQLAPFEFPSCSFVDHCRSFPFVADCADFVPRDQTPTPLFLHQESTRYRPVSYLIGFQVFDLFNLL